VHVQSPKLHAIVQRPSHRTLQVDALQSIAHVAFAAQLGVHVARSQSTLHVLPDSQVGAHVVARHSSSHDFPPPQTHADVPQTGFVVSDVGGPASAPRWPMVKS
jgi:hypothetical protein